MVFRAIFLTIVGLAAFVGIFGYLLRPFWSRIWCYWCAIKAQDEEAQRDALEIERLKKQALEELENGNVPKQSETAEQQQLNQ